MSDLGNHVRYLESGGLKRRYVLHIPPRHPPQPRPLLVMLDGRGGTPWTAMKITGWTKTADTHDVLVAYPEARRIDPQGPLHFLTNPQMWNAGTGGSDAERPPVDDLSFLNAMLDDIPKLADVDPSRIYMTGFSNGASMTYRFAAAFPSRLAAIAPIAGHDRTDGEPLPIPVPSLTIFGKKDPLSPYEGGRVELPWGKVESRPPAFASTQRWAVRCGHARGDFLHERGPGYDHYHYGQTGKPNEVVFYGVDRLGHVWPGGHRLLPESLVGPADDTLIANDIIWSFFSRHQTKT
ncbi:MAG TPA: PHB depolymerase family esterase [Kiritimatiellia bacterium]|nr:PHB depolymerase family esterase [Kiritimatiellia bacterium]